MSYMPILYARPSLPTPSRSIQQYPSIWTILDVAAKSRFKPNLDLTNIGSVVNMVTPSGDERVRNLKNNCAYRRVGMYPSAKNGKMIHTESFIERKLAHLLEFHPEVISYKEQPCFIEWLDQQGHHHIHIPDFRVNFRNGNTLIVETKPDSVCTDQSVKDRTLILSQGVGAQFGFQYILVVESQLDGVEQDNADTIRNFPMDYIPSYEFEEVRRLFEQHQFLICLTDVYNYTNVPNPQKVEMNIKNMIRRGVVTFDMSKPLAMNTVLTWNERGMQ